MTLEPKAGEAEPSPPSAMIPPSPACRTWRLEDAAHIGAPRWPTVGYTTSRDTIAPGHKIYPYLLRGVKVGRPDHVWAMDISYIPMRRGFVCPAAVVDVASRRVLAHRVSITMEASFCVEALAEAMARHGKPEIFNTDQRSQFTDMLAGKIAAAVDPIDTFRRSEGQQKATAAAQLQAAGVRNN